MLAACGGGETYALPEKAVHSKLLSVGPPALVFGNSGLTSSVAEVGDNQVVWSLKSNGETVMKFVATITPNNEKSTSVALAVESTDGTAGTKVAKNMAEHPEIVTLYQAAMAEQVDAALDGREFNYMNIRNETMRAAVANEGDLQNAVTKQHDADRAEDKGRDEAKADADPWNQ